MKLAILCIIGGILYAAVGITLAKTGWVQDYRLWMFIGCVYGMLANAAISAAVRR